MDRFLGRLEMPALLESDRDKLASPIVLEELQQAVASVSKSKIPWTRRVTIRDLQILRGRY